MAEFIEFEARGNFEEFRRLARDPGERLTMVDGDGGGAWEGKLVIDAIADGVLHGRLVELKRVSFSRTGSS